MNLVFGSAWIKSLGTNYYSKRISGFSLVLRCMEASSDVRFPLQNRNRNRNLVEAYGISIPNRLQNILFKNTLEAYDSVLESRFRSLKKIQCHISIKNIIIVFNLYKIQILIVMNIENINI